MLKKTNKQTNKQTNKKNTHRKVIQKNLSPEVWGKKILPKPNHPYPRRFSPSEKQYREKRRSEIRLLFADYARYCNAIYLSLLRGRPLNF